MTILITSKASDPGYPKLMTVALTTSVLDEVINKNHSYKIHFYLRVSIFNT